MQKFWTVCLSVLMGAAFVAFYPTPADLTAIKGEKEVYESLESQAADIKIPAASPLEELAGSFPVHEEKTASEPETSSEPAVSSLSPGTSSPSPDVSSASSQPGDTADSSSEAAVAADSSGAIEVTEFYIPEIPLSQELQYYTYQQCMEKDVSYELVLAMMYHESNYDVSAVRYYEDGSSDSGIMQINSINAQSLYEQYGITNLQDPYENILAGVSIISGFVHQYGEHDGLMAYNMGAGGYQNALANGIYTTAYAQNILETKSYIESLRRSL